MYGVMMVIHVSRLCIMLLFLFSSRRRHTRCALVTGVQTCALPICEQCVRCVATATIGKGAFLGHIGQEADVAYKQGLVDGQACVQAAKAVVLRRSEERCVGKEWVGRCSYRW